MTRAAREFRKQLEAEKLDESVREAFDLSERLGMNPYDGKFWIVDHDEMNELGAYVGFQDRWPHWRWGMMYDQQQKQGQHFGGKAYELVINDNPFHAYLQMSNTLDDQKAVITHVMGHSDFFANNQWFHQYADPDKLDAAGMIHGNADAIREYMEDSDIGRDTVERWIDNLLCLEDNIDQYEAYSQDKSGYADDEEKPKKSLKESLEGMDLDPDVRAQMFDKDAEWIKKQEEAENEIEIIPKNPEKDLLYFLREYGKAIDDETGKAVDFTDWQEDVVERIRQESYYFAPQKMTKVMNEGWAAYWESMMMGDEQFSDENEYVHYANHQSMVLGSPGVNPYKLGKLIWEYVENSTNREEVVGQLLQIDGVTQYNLKDAVDLREVEQYFAEDTLLDTAPASLNELDPNDPRIDEDNLVRAQGLETYIDSLEEDGILDQYVDDVTSAIPDLISSGMEREDAIEALTAQDVIDDTDAVNAFANDVYDAMFRGDMAHIEDDEMRLLMKQYEEPFNQKYIVELEQLVPHKLQDRTPEEFLQVKLADMLKDHLRSELNVHKYPWKVFTYDGLAERDYSLGKPQNQQFIQSITTDEINNIAEQTGVSDTYESVDEALKHVDYTAGWDRMYEIREDHNDIEFIDEFMTQEFVDKNKYYAYEWMIDPNGQPRRYVTSKDADDVKKKLLLERVNFGKPTITVEDGNYENGGLLLAHNYNGVQLDVNDAVATTQRLHELWGRDVYLKTIIKQHDEEGHQEATESLYMNQQYGVEEDINIELPDEQPMMLHYDGESVDWYEIDWSEVEDISASPLDYDTKPEDWIA